MHSVVERPLDDAGGYRLLGQTAKDRRSVTSDSRQRALALIQEYGWNNTSFQTLEPFFEYWFDPSGPGVVAYYRAWGTWVVAGAPICPLDRMVECGLAFAEAAKAAGYRVCFFGTAARFAEQISQHATHVKIGEQPCWDPTRWHGDAKRMKLIGSQIRRAERKGLTVRQVSPQVMNDSHSYERQQAEKVIIEWQRAHKMATMSFVVHLDAFSFASERRYFLAERKSADDAESAAVGFLSLVPIYARGGFFLEDLVRTPAAPNGTTEALIDAAMRALGVEGKTYATLGLSPLRNTHQSHYAQPRWAVAIFHVSRRLFDPLYSFEGLAAFKSKLQPEQWEEIYVTGIPKFNFSMLIAVLMAFVRSHPTRFAWDTLVRLVTANVRRVRQVTWQRLSYGLAVTLAAWTGLLSQSDGVFWFGSAAMLQAWIAFDCLMVGVLLALGYGARHRASFLRWLAPCAWLAVLGDVGLTAWQAATFLSEHTWNRAHAVAWSIAVGGPAIATVFVTCFIIRFSIRSDKTFSDRRRKE